LHLTRLVSPRTHNVSPRRRRSSPSPSRTFFAYLPSCRIFATPFPVLCGPNSSRPSCGSEGFYLFFPSVVSVELRSVGRRPPRPWFQSALEMWGVSRTSVVLTICYQSVSVQESDFVPRSQTKCSSFFCVVTSTDA